MTATTEAPAVADAVAAEQLRADLEQLRQDWADGTASDAWVRVRLRDLRDDLTPEQCWELWEQYADACERRDEAVDPSFDLATLEPEWRDAELYETRCQALVDEALTALTGRTT